MSPANIPLAARNLSRAFINRAARLYRRLSHRARRGAKRAGEARKRAQAGVRQSIAFGRQTAHSRYRGTVRTVRYLKRVESQVWPRVRREFHVHRDLRAAAAGAHPIIVGPWLSEVGYEVLYWIPFLRWFCDRYRVDPSRLVVVSRGGVAGWYAGVAEGYVELLDLFPPGEFATLNAARQAEGDQKQQGISGFDEAILERVRAMDGLGPAGVCHPSTMFRLLKQFWLGNESLQYAQGYLHFDSVSPPAIDLSGLPDRFVAVKFYTGKAMLDTPATRRALRGLVERCAAQGPVVTLDTGIALDEHSDYLFHDLPGVIDIGRWLTPQNNLGVQTEVIRRADRFIGTCGSLAWLAPMLGTPTVAVYSDDELLGPHLYAARAAFRAMRCAPFATLDLDALGAFEDTWTERPRS